MDTRIIGSLRCLEFEHLDPTNVSHGLFTRHGGVSPSPWKSLNLGGTVGDDPERVRDNRRLAFSAINMDIHSVYDVWQVHSDQIVCTDAPRPLSHPHVQADAILTDRPGVVLFMRFADCVPLLYYDPVKQVIGMAHAGWKGTIIGIASKMVKTMQDVYGSRPEHIQAFIGPSIGPDHYVVGAEVAGRVRDVFGSDADALLPVEKGATIFDLWAANRLWLKRAGVQKIEQAGICTACGVDDWFSHRAEGGRTGRFGAMISLRS